jgi:enoyl-CoA hydratase/carnithine racemase
MMADLSGFSTIEVERDVPVGLIRLNRPDKYNAISTSMMAEVVDALAALETAPGIVGVLLCGSDRYFSTGADLDEALTVSTPQEYVAYNRSWRRLTSAVERLTKPVIACISGYCYTGGLELALACDIRVASDDATFAITSARIGSVAGAGGTQRLPRVVGPGRAKAMLFTAEPIDAHEADRIGLIDVLVPPGEVEEWARAQVEVFSRRGPLSLAWAKQAVNVGMNLDLESALDLEANLSARAFATEDKAEGMRAFLEKRAPVFKGR